MQQSTDRMRSQAASRRESPTQCLHPCKRYRRVRIFRQEPQKFDPGQFVPAQLSAVSISRGAASECRSHFPNIPLMTDRDRPVRLGSVWPEASRISSIQATSLRVTIVPKICSIARAVVAPPI